jgi:hypothetical protein
MFSGNNKLSSASILEKLKNLETELRYARAEITNLRVVVDNHDEIKSLIETAKKYDQLKTKYKLSASSGGIEAFNVAAMHHFFTIQEFRDHVNKLVAKHHLSKCKK